MSKQRRLKTCFGRRAIRVLLIVLGAFLALAGANCERRSVADSAITAIVKSKLAVDNETSSANISVDTKGGVVTLTGVVMTQANKEQAERIARNTEGVTRVINNITVETDGEHAGAGAGVFAIRFDRDVINDARNAFGVPGYPLGLLFIGLSHDDAGQRDHAAFRIHADVGRAGLIVHRQFAFHYGGDGGVGDAPPFAIRARQREECPQYNQQNPYGPPSEAGFQPSLFTHGDLLKAGSNLKSDSAKGVLRALRAF